MMYLLTAIFAVIIVCFVLAEYKDYEKTKKEQEERMKIKKKYRRDNNETD